MNRLYVIESETVETGQVHGSNFWYDSPNSDHSIVTIKNSAILAHITGGMCTCACTNTKYVNGKHVGMPVSGGSREILWVGCVKNKDECIHECGKLNGVWGSGWEKFQCLSSSNVPYVGGCALNRNTAHDEL